MKARLHQMLCNIHKLILFTAFILNIAKNFEFDHVVLNVRAKSGEVHLLNLKSNTCIKELNLFYD